MSIKAETIMDEIVNHLQNEGIIPVVTINRSEDACQIMEALLKGGITTIEITLRTDEGVTSIAQIKKNFPEVAVGAGTVTSIERLEGAISAGADFLVTPGLNEIIVRRAIQAGKVIFPGIVTPTELDEGMSLGLDVFKFFPSEVFGGIKAIKALAGPFPTVRFIPTGGISLENAQQYLSDKHVLAVGGSWLVKNAWVESSNFYEITKCALDAHALVNKVKAEVLTHA